MLDQLAEGESLQQRDDVRETLMERGHVRVGVLEVPVMDRIQDRVRHLVGDDVRAQAREDETARIVGALALIGGGEIAEQQRRLSGS